MKYRIFDNNNNTIGKIENNYVYDEYNNRVCAVEDGVFLDPITREVFYKIHDDGTITKGTSSEIAGYVQSDGNITKRGSSNKVGQIVNDKPVFIASDGDIVGIAAFFGIVIMIIGAFVVWPALLESDGVLVIILSLSFALLYCKHLIKKNMHSIPLLKIGLFLTIINSMIFLAYGSIVDSKIYFLDFKYLLVGCFFGVLLAVIPTVIIKSVLYLHRNLRKEYNIN